MEELHEDLKANETDGMLHHPLLIDPVCNNASRINEVYRQKADRLNQGEGDGDWEEYIFLHERPYRIDALLAASEKGLVKRPAEFWKLVGRVWLDSESISVNMDTWRDIWGSSVPDRHACMSDDDRRVFESLPQEIEVWRGIEPGDEIDGFSWSLDKVKAIWSTKDFVRNQMSRFS